MLKKTYKIFIPILFLLIWIVINDGATLMNIFIGIIVTIFSIVIANYLLDFSYLDAFSLPPVKLIKYLLFLIKEIYISGIRATIMIITGKIKPGFLVNKIDPNIKNVYLHNILAISITLTPGTITVENKDGTLTVLSMHTDNKNPAQSFEPHLLEIENELAKKLDKK